MVSKWIGSLKKLPPPPAPVLAALPTKGVDDFTKAAPLLGPVVPPRKQNALVGVISTANVEVIDATDVPRDAFLCGDSIAALALMPDKCVDHTITDPPYEEHTHTKAVRHTGAAGGEYKGTVVDDFGFEHISHEQRIECARQIVRTTRGWAIIFCEDDALAAWRRALCWHHPKADEPERCRYCRQLFTRSLSHTQMQCPAMAKWRRNIVWHKTNAMPKLHGDGAAQATEHAVSVWCGSGPSEWNRGGRGNLWAYPKEHSEIHKTKKPTALITDLVLSFTRPGELVCDPFAGSGTTPIACRRTGRNFIAWEFRPETHALALADVQKAREQLDIFASSFRGDTTMRAGAFDDEEGINRRVNAQAPLIAEPPKVKKTRKARA